MSARLGEATPHCFTMLLPFLAALIPLLSVPQVLAARNKTYNNPILPGFHPDPSCTLVPEWDNTFFCATSSFNAIPGIPIFASKDLQNFRQIGNVLTRKSRKCALQCIMTSVRGLSSFFCILLSQELPGLAITNGSTSGIWAPSIRYHDNLLWIVTTLVYDNRTATDTTRWDNVSSSVHSSIIGNDEPVSFLFRLYSTLSTLMTRVCGQIRFILRSKVMTLLHSGLRMVRAILSGATRGRYKK